MSIYIYIYICLLSKQISFVFVYREGQYQGFQPLDVQSEIQSSDEPSTAVVFNDYPSVNTNDGYSSFNDSSEFYKNYHQVFYMANAITM